MKTVEEIISEQQSKSNEVTQRSSTAGLLKAITQDAKDFFTNLFKVSADKLADNKFDVEVKNQIVLPKVQQIDGSVSLKDTKALLIGLNEIVRGIEKANKTYEQSSKGLEKNLKPEKVDFSKLEQAIKDIYIPEPNTRVSADITSLPKYIAEKLDDIKKAINKIEVSPVVNVDNKTPEVTIDLQGVKDSLQAILEAITAQEKPEVNIDMKSVKDAVKKVQDAIENLRFPIPSGHVTVTNLPLDSSGNVKISSSDNQVIIDKSVSGTTYFGFGARGLSQSTTGWLIKKMVKSGTTTTVTHAIDAWSNRATATYS